MLLNLLLSMLAQVGRTLMLLLISLPMLIGRSRLGRRLSKGRLSPLPPGNLPSLPANLPSNLGRSPFWVPLPPIFEPSPGRSPWCMPRKSLTSPAEGRPILPGPSPILPPPLLPAIPSPPGRLAIPPGRLPARPGALVLGRSKGRSPPMFPGRSGRVAGRLAMPESPPPPAGRVDGFRPPLGRLIWGVLGREIFPEGRLATAG